MQYGILYFIIDGIRVNIKGNFIATPGGRKPEPIANPDGTVDYSTVGVVPRITGDIALPNNISLKQIQNLKGVTITLATDQGKSYNLSDARNVAEIALNPEDGTVSCDFVGAQMDEI